MKRTGVVTDEVKTFYHDSKTANGKDAPYSLFILDAGKRGNVFENDNLTVHEMSKKLLKKLIDIVANMAFSC